MIDAEVASSNGRRPYKLIGVVANIPPCSTLLTMRDVSDCARVKVGNYVKLLPPHARLTPDSFRHGFGRIDAIMTDRGVIELNNNVRVLMPDAQDGDWLYVVESSVATHEIDGHGLTKEQADAVTYLNDHAALVAYLLSAVRRRDWHAVSDAANDLRVLEAKQR